MTLSTVFVHRPASKRLAWLVCDLALCAVPVIIVLVVPTDMTPSWRIAIASATVVAFVAPIARLSLRADGHGLRIRNK